MPRRGTHLTLALRRRSRPLRTSPLAAFALPGLRPIPARAPRPPYFPVLSTGRRGGGGCLCPLPWTLSEDEDLRPLLEMCGPSRGLHRRSRRPPSRCRFIFQTRAGDAGEVRRMHADRAIRRPRPAAPPPHRLGAIRPRHETSGSDEPPDGARQRRNEVGRAGRLTRTHPLPLHAALAQYRVP
jgi:hypothetical protein